MIFRFPARHPAGIGVYSADTFAQVAELADALL